MHPDNANLDVAELQKTADAKFEDALAGRNWAWIYRRARSLLQLHFRCSGIIDDQLSDPSLAAHERTVERPKRFFETIQGF